MHDSRKSLLSVIFDNLLNALNIVCIVLLVVFILDKSYLFIIPMVLCLIASLFLLVVELKRFVLIKKHKQRICIVEDGQDKETSFSNLKLGDHVHLYPHEEIYFVGKIVSGNALVDESSITGATELVRKTAGSSIIRGSIVVEGNCVAEVIELKERTAKSTFVKETKIEKRIKFFNLVFSSLSLLILLLSIIFDRIKGTFLFTNSSKAVLASVPYLVNIVLIMFTIISSKKNHFDGVKVLDCSALAELADVDVVCFDKTGTLTTGDYDIYKTIVLSQSALLSFTIDTNRAFEQIVSNILRTTKDKYGYFASLQNHFVYDVSKMIESSSPIRNNGLYSAITIKGGVSYAIGEPTNFELLNQESSMSAVNEYQALGYQVLMLVESKNPLNCGLIDGKCTAIGLIILQEKIRESAVELIKYCLEKGKQIKVISGDRIAITSEIARKAGLDTLNHSTSVKKMPFEKLKLLINQDIVFADASPSQKSFIVRTLQDQGHVVAFIGDGDNDTQALKAADVGVAMSGGSANAIRCSNIIANDEFKMSNKFFEYVVSTKGKLEHVLSILYSQSIFASFYLIAFFIANLINRDIYNPFEYQHLLLWLLIGIVAPVLVIIFENNSGRYYKKCFCRNLFADSLLLIVPIGAIYIAQLLQYNGHGFYAIPSDVNELHETLITSIVADNLSYLVLLIGSLFITYNHLLPMNKFRGVAFGVIALLPFVYGILLAFGVDALSPFTQISTSELNPVNYFVAGIIILFCGALYLLIIDIIKTVKGENQNVKSKS